jgi:hypothetical protein
MKLKSIAVLLAVYASVSSAQAANISYTGQFAHDNDVALISFNVSAPSTVELRSYGYAGGVNAAGQTIARGGFDPIIELFNAAGLQIGGQDDVGDGVRCGAVAKDAVTHYCWDVDYIVKLAAGSYTVSLQQYNNYSVSNNLADGFYYQDPNFRNGFVDEMDVKRNGSWALDLLNVAPVAPVDQATVPEPASLSLMGVAMAGMATLRRRRKSASSRK